MELDSYDRKILFELDCNSRQSISELARTVHLGRDLVTYRIERMQQNGILKRFAAMLNPYRLGLTVYQTYLKVEVNRPRLEELIAVLDNDPRIWWLAECHGKWDVIFCVLARTPLEFYTFQDKLFSDFRDIILAHHASTLVNYWWYPKKYLLGNHWREEWKKVEGGDCNSNHVRCWKFAAPAFTFGATPASFEIDALESRIVEALGIDARLSVVELAKMLKTTPAIIKHRLESLEKHGIIAGYRIDMDQTALGRTQFKVLVHQRDYSRSQEIAFRDFCREHPLISEYIQQIGDCRIEFGVEVRDYAEFHSVLDEVRERFSKNVRYMDYMAIHKDYHHRTRYLCLNQTEQQHIAQQPAASITSIRAAG